MTYHSLAKANERYLLTVMALLFGAFVIAMALMFLHPTAALLVFAMGLTALGVAAVIEKLIKRTQRTLAKDALKTHRCPHCDAEIDRDPQGTTGWHCDNCAATFLDTGDELP